MQRTVSDICEWSTDDLRNYVKIRIPKSDHFWATREQLILIVARIMDANGELNSRDSEIIHTPGFDRIFILEKGDLSAAIVHLGIDTSLSFLSTATNL
jgi:hypothetical protein